MIIESMSIITLNLSDNNPFNTTFVDADSGKAVYSVKTEHEDSENGEKTWTTIKRLEGNGEEVVLCKSEWRNVLSDLITMGQRTEAIPANTWLKKSVIPFVSHVTFIANDGKEYIWKGNDIGSSLELYSHEDKKSPIAKYQKPRYVASGSKERTPPALLFDERGAEVMDDVLVTWCLLEKTRRGRDPEPNSQLRTHGSPGVIGMMGPTY